MRSVYLADAFALPCVPLAFQGDRSYNFKVHLPPNTYFLKKAAGIERGSTAPGVLDKQRLQPRQSEQYNLHIYRPTSKSYTIHSISNVNTIGSVKYPLANAQQSAIHCLHHFFPSSTLSRKRSWRHCDAQASVRDCENQAAGDLMGRVSLAEARVRVLVGVWNQFFPLHCSHPNLFTRRYSLAGAPCLTRMYTPDG